MNEKMIELCSEITTTIIFGIVAFYSARRLLKFTKSRMLPSYDDFFVNTTIKIKSFVLMKFTLSLVLFFISIFFYVFSLATFFGIPAQILKKISKDIAFKDIYIDTSNSDAICSQGCAYLYGYRVEKNYIKAKEYFESGVRLNDPRAMVLLGNMYHFGLGVPIDSKKAYDYYCQAAKLNDSNAQASLGSLYLSGELGVKDIKKGLHYLELAASQKNNEALYHLGLFYELGIHIPSDIEQSKKYYVEAAKNDHESAQFRLAGLYYNDNNFHEAKKLFETCAHKGNSEAARILGLLYFKGNGVTKNYHQAKKLFEKAVLKDNDAACLDLAYLYLHGLGVSQNSSKAISYYEKAAKQGNSTAQLELGTHYIAGIRCERDITKAIEYLSASAKENDSANYFLQSLNNPLKKDKLITDVTKEMKIQFALIAYNNGN